MAEDFLSYPQEEQKPSFSNQIIEIIQSFVVFAAIGTVIYLFVAQPHKVSGNSMFPNYHDGDYIITDKISYKIGEIQRGDIVVIKSPYDDAIEFIKRVIAIPGDKVKISEGRVYLNGQALEEKFLKNVTTPAGQFLSENQEVEVPAGSYLAFGDNRPRSSDSREWGFIKKDKIIGKVFLRYWPKESIGLYPAYTK